MIFKNDEHKKFYRRWAKKLGNDRERLSLFYLLGVTDATRTHWADCYSTKNNAIDTDCLGKAWITGGSHRAIELGFQLYGYVPEENPPTVVDLFGYAELYPYFVQAMDIRFGVERQERKESTGRPPKYTRNAKLEVLDIREGGISIRNIAAALGMSTATVQKIIKEKL